MKKVFKKRRIVSADSHWNDKVSIYFFGIRIFSYYVLND